MTDIQIFHCEEPASWNSAVERCAWHDFYHLAEYHLLHKQEGQGILIVISEDEKTIAFPLLVRPIEEVGGLEDFSGYFDATSVYGYPGPITNAETDIRFLKQAGWVLGNILRDQKIISVFSRLHPILGNDKYVFVGAAIPIGETISIDLTLPEEQQTKLYRKNHQRDIKKALHNNLICFEDKEWSRYDDFIRLYYATMERVGAEVRYFFSREYFDELRVALKDSLRLFIVTQEDVVLSAGLFTLVRGIVQYHLGASNPNFMQHHAASKLLFDTVRRWASKYNATVFHLGGGVGGKNDSLFNFKRGFSDRIHTFWIWKYIVDKCCYEQALAARHAWLTMNNLALTENSYFPAYRASPQNKG